MNVNYESSFISHPLYSAVKAQIQPKVKSLQPAPVTFADKWQRNLQL